MRKNGRVSYIFGKLARETEKGYTFFQYNPVSRQYGIKPWYIHKDKILCCLKTTKGQEK